MIMPLSFWTEFNNALRQRIGCFSIILVLPALSIIFIPFYFEFVTLRFMVQNYWTEWLAKLSLVISLWLFVVSLFFYIKTMVLTNDANKKDGII